MEQFREILLKNVPRGTNYEHFTTLTINIALTLVNYR